MHNGVHNNSLPDSPNDVDELIHDWYDLKNLSGLPASPNDQEKLISYTEHRYNVSRTTPTNFQSLKKCNQNTINKIINNIYSKTISRCNLIIGDCRDYDADCIIYAIAKGISCENFIEDICNNCSNCYHFDYIDNDPYLPVYQFDYARNVEDINISDFEYKYKPLSDQFKHTFIYIKKVSHLYPKRLEKLVDLLRATDENTIFMLHEYRLKDINLDLINMSRIYDIRK